MYNLAIVTPLAREGSSVNKLIEHSLARINSNSAIYYVLDRASCAQTRQEVEKWCLRDARVRLVWCPESRCVVDAYFAGYRVAYEAGFEWILEMDAGFSHKPDEIGLFIEMMAKGYDYVGGSRYTLGGQHRGPLARRFLSYAGTVMARLLLGAKMTDMTSGFQCFSRRALQRILQAGVKSRANFFQTEIRHVMHNLHWCEVPITYSTDKSRVVRGAVFESLKVLGKMVVVHRRQQFSRAMQALFSNRKHSGLAAE